MNGCDCCTEHDRCGHCQWRINEDGAITCTLCGHAYASLSERLTDPLLALSTGESYSQSVWTAMPRHKTGPEAAPPARGLSHSTNQVQVAS